MRKLLETFQELNLSNYGPDDVDQLNAWAIDAYAELAVPKTQEPVAEFFALDDGIGTIMAAWADGFEPVVGQKLYAAPVISAKQQVALPEWAPCNPGCDPEFNGQRSAGCARYCENARAAMLVAAPAPVSEAKAQGVVMLPSVTEVMNIVFDYQHNKNKNVTGTTNWAANIGMAVIDEVARLNAAPVQQVSVPDGWKLVPVNATEAILDVLYSNGMDESDSLLQDIWSAIIAAAPAAPAADAGLVEALELAANRLDRLALEQGEFWRGYATAWADEARATANGVKS